MVKLIQKSTEMNDYLSSNRYIDLSDPSIQRKAKELFVSPSSENEKIKTAFEFVRDGIKHSRDIDSEIVTVSASDALRHGEGICLSKSLLLAALLRYEGIPAGLCYQRLASNDTPTGYIIHGLNAVFLSSENKWIRLDARGNKPGVDAQFSVAEERIAFPVKAERGETDLPAIYADPPSSVMEAWAKCRSHREYRFDTAEL
ncbi:MAG: transglutaminase family protein [Methanomassiliicoccaceae archaeon]|nr:transglutaminase family protein [Methanomassiliicoccaceae archaeon]